MGTKLGIFFLFCKLFFSTDYYNADSTLVGRQHPCTVQGAFISLLPIVEKFLPGVRIKGVYLQCGPSGTESFQGAVKKHFCPLDAWLMSA